MLSIQYFIINAESKIRNFIAFIRKILFDNEDERVSFPPQPSRGRGLRGGITINEFSELLQDYLKKYTIYYEKKEKTETTIKYSELIGKEFDEPEKVKVPEKVKTTQRELTLNEQMRNTVAGMLSNWEKHRHDFIKMHGIETYEEVPFSISQ